MTPNPPSIPLLKHLITTSADDHLVWASTGKRCVVRGLFGTPPQVVLGFLAVSEDDVRFALANDRWPDDIADRPEPHIRRGDWEFAWARFDRALQRAEEAAA